MTIVCISLLVAGFTICVVGLLVTGFVIASHISPETEEEKTIRLYKQGMKRKEHIK